MKAKVQVVITYETDLPDDPEAYLGATTPRARMAQEIEWINEDGDYLISILGEVKFDSQTTITAIDDSLEENRS